MNLYFSYNSKWGVQGLINNGSDHNTMSKNGSHGVMIDISTVYI